MKENYLMSTQCASQSLFTIVPQKGGWCVGDELTVRILLKDHNGNTKRNGGDFLIAKLHNQQLNAGVVGTVQDHLNGTFSAVFPLLWKGAADVEVTLVQTKKAPLCDFSDPNTGEQWICYKPSTLDCDTRVIHSKNVIPHSTISKEEEALFQKRINMKVPLKAVGNKSILILPKKGNKFKKMSVGPSGYYYNEQWRSLSGPAIRPFNNISVTACLRGKRMYFFGDSTIRQYYLYITALLNLQTFDKNNPPQSGPFMAIDYRRDILVSFRAHGLPIRFVDVQPAQLRYVANELDGLIGGPNTVIVVIRSANMKDLTLTESQANSDWYSLQQNKVLRAVFKDTGVFLLDAWQMVQTHHLPHNLHPPPQIIKIMIDAIMSYTCPQM
uniref:NXPE C-terminal domain-containing protein n=1 Tax=Knipowitschia caucasica TaxID=637954 RepID=A0AAV2IU88_KNICA